MKKEKEDKEEEKEKEDKEEKEKGDGTSNEDERLVITVRCIDMATPKTEVDKIPCSECGEMTWISTSFRGKKIDRAVCEPCFFGNDRYKNENYFACVTQECIDEAFAWAIRSGYNVTKEHMIKKMEDKIGKKIKVVKNMRRHE